MKPNKITSDVDEQNGGQLQENERHQRDRLRRQVLEEAKNKQLEKKHKKAARRKARNKKLPVASSSDQTATRSLPVVTSSSNGCGMEQTASSLRADTSMVSCDVFDHHQPLDLRNGDIFSDTDVQKSKAIFTIKTKHSMDILSDISFGVRGKLSTKQLVSLSPITDGKTLTEHPEVTDQLLSQSNIDQCIVRYNRLALDTNMEAIEELRDITVPKHQDSLMLDIAEITPSEGKEHLKTCVSSMSAVPLYLKPVSLVTLPMCEHHCLIYCKFCGDKNVVPPGNSDKAVQRGTDQSFGKNTDLATYNSKAAHISKCVHSDQSSISFLSLMPNSSASNCHFLHEAAPETGEFNCLVQLQFPRHLSFNAGSIHLEKCQIKIILSQYSTGADISNEDLKHNHKIIPRFLSQNLQQRRLQIMLTKLLGETKFSALVGKHYYLNMFTSLPSRPVLKDVSCHTVSPQKSNATSSSIFPVQDTDRVCEASDDNVDEDLYKCTENNCQLETSCLEVFKFVQCEKGESPTNKAQLVPFCHRFENSELANVVETVCKCAKDDCQSETAGIKGLQHNHCESPPTTKEQLGPFCHSFANSESANVDVAVYTCTIYDCQSEKSFVEVLQNIQCENCESPPATKAQLVPSCNRFENSELVNVDEVSQKGKSYSLVNVDEMSQNREDHSLVNVNEMSQNREDHSLVNVDEMSQNGEDHSLVNVNEMSQNREDHSLVNVNEMSQNREDHSLVNVDEMSQNGEDHSLVNVDEMSQNEGYSLVNVDEMSQTGEDQSLTDADPESCQDRHNHILDEECVHGEDSFKKRNVASDLWCPIRQEFVPDNWDDDLLSDEDVGDLSSICVTTDVSIFLPASERHMFAETGIEYESNEQKCSNQQSLNVEIRDQNISCCQEVVENVTVVCDNTSKQTKDTVSEVGEHDKGKYCDGNDKVKFSEMPTPLQQHKTVMKMQGKGKYLHNDHQLLHKPDLKWHQGADLGPFTEAERNQSNGRVWPTHVSNQSQPQRLHTELLTHTEPEGNRSTEKVWPTHVSNQSQPQRLHTELLTQRETDRNKNNEKLWLTHVSNQSQLQRLHTELLTHRETDRNKSNEKLWLTLVSNQSQPRRLHTELVTHTEAERNKSKEKQWQTDVVSNQSRPYKLQTAELLTHREAERNKSHEKEGPTHVVSNHSQPQRLHTTELLTHHLHQLNVETEIEQRSEQCELTSYLNKIFGALQNSSDKKNITECDIMIKAHELNVSDNSLGSSKNYIPADFVNLQEARVLGHGKDELYYRTDIVENNLLSKNFQNPGAVVNSGRDCSFHNMKSVCQLDQNVKKKWELIPDSVSKVGTAETSMNHVITGYKHQQKTEFPLVSLTPADSDNVTYVECNTNKQIYNSGLPVNNESTVHMNSNTNNSPGKCHTMHPLAHPSLIHVASNNSCHLPTGADLNNLIALTVQKEQERLYLLLCDLQAKVLALARVMKTCNTRNSSLAGGSDIDDFKNTRSLPGIKELSLGQIETIIDRFELVVNKCGMSAAEQTSTKSVPRNKHGRNCQSIIPLQRDEKEKKVDQRELSDAELDNILKRLHMLDVNDMKTSHTSGQSTSHSINESCQDSSLNGNRCFRNPQLQSRLPKCPPTTCEQKPWVGKTNKLQTLLFQKKKTNKTVSSCKVEADQLIKYPNNPSRNSTDVTWDLQELQRHLKRTPSQSGNLTLSRANDESSTTMNSLCQSTEENRTNIPECDNSKVLYKFFRRRVVKVPDKSLSERENREIEISNLRPIRFPTEVGHRPPTSKDPSRSLSLSGSTIPVLRKNTAMQTTESSQFNYCLPSKSQRPVFTVSKTLPKKTSELYTKDDW